MAGSVADLVLVVAGVGFLFGSLRAVTGGGVTSEKAKGGSVFAVGAGLLFIGYGLYEFYGIGETEFARPADAILFVAITVALGGYLYAKRAED